MLKPFLTANWRYPAMMNFIVDPKILLSFVPEGTELDLYEGETFLSVAQVWRRVDDPVLIEAMTANDP